MFAFLKSLTFDIFFFYIGLDYDTTGMGMESGINRRNEKINGLKIF